MIEIDYGKEAYVKLQQLDKYVKNLEKEHLCLPDLIPWIYLSLTLYNHKGLQIQ